MIGRLRRAWGVLVAEQRMVVLAAVLVLASMLLPWYTKTTSAVTKGGLATTDQAKIAITVPSFVEASIFLVAVSVLALMFARGERKPFHLPFGDGAIVTAAGAWTAFLIFFRFIDQPSGGTSDKIAYDYGLSWGIFFGLLAAGFFVYTGTRLRFAHVPEPPLPADPRPDPPVPPASPAGRPPRRPAPGPPTAATRVDRGEQLSFDEQE